MSGQQHMTALQMFSVLERLGLRYVQNVPATFAMPSAYYYAPTFVVYSTADDDNAELVGNIGRDQERDANRHETG